MNVMNYRTRIAAYIAILCGVNACVAGNLFFVEFTNNMQSIAGLFIGITRFILGNFPHLQWTPWWLNGTPFENTYTPMLHLMDAAFAWITRNSAARAYNALTGFFYVAGPVLLFLFAWRITGFLETSFFAALLYSLFSPAVLFSLFRRDVGLWNPWRFRVLVFWGEGPHIAALAVLPLALLFTYCALTTRRYFYYTAAAISMAWIVLTNAFGAVDLGLGCACLVLALPRKEILKTALLVLGVAAAAYLFSIPFLTPAVIRTISHDSQQVGGEFSASQLRVGQVVLFAILAVVWLATQRLTDYFLRFTVLLTSAFLAIVGMYALARLPALPQPHRYSVELEMAVSVLLTLVLRPLTLRLPATAKYVAFALVLSGAVHQIIQYRRYASDLTRPIDVSHTVEYKAAKWFDSNMPEMRAFVGGETGLWLNVFSDTPQMNSGATPFDPNFRVDSAVTYSMYAGSDATDSILWLKAFGCHAIQVGHSRLYGDLFQHPRKFDGVLPVLWREEQAVIYAVPERTKSLGHVVPDDAIVQHEPINGADLAEVMRYVAALDDAALPSDVMRWTSPDRGHLETTLRSRQALSVQVTYDPGWIAFANGKPAGVSRDGLGLSVIHPECDGPCSVDFVFDGGRERKLYRIVSGLTVLLGLLGGYLTYSRSRGTI